MNTLFLTYAGPPLIGATIGYITNKIAIQMLFRPLKPWHILGIRVPMTPGIIPAKRNDLANNIGRMVGEHLLTADEISAALSRKQFQDYLYTLVEEQLNTLWTTDLGSILSLIPEKFRTLAHEGLRALKHQMKDWIHSCLESESFEKVLAEALNEQIELYGNKELNMLISPKKRQRLYDFF